MELTENTQYLLPIVLAVMSAKWVGDAFSRSIYEELIEIKSLPALQHHPPHKTNLWTVKDVMASPVVTLREVESVDRIMRILRDSTHMGFPVVTGGQDELGFYRGFILRKQLLILLDKQLYKPKGPNYGQAGLLEYEYYNSLMNQKLSLDKVKIPPEFSQPDLELDVTPYMNQSQLVVTDNFSYPEVYKLFQTLGLRHIPVVDHHFRVKGMITRHDLLSFHFK